MSSRVYLKFPNDRWVLHLLLSLAPVELEGITKVRQALKGLHVLQLCVIDLPQAGRRDGDKRAREKRNSKGRGNEDSVRGKEGREETEKKMRGKQHKQIRETKAKRRAGRRDGDKRGAKKEERQERERTEAEINHNNNKSK